MLQPLDNMPSLAKKNHTKIPMVPNDPGKKKCKDKARWVVAVEVAIIVMLLTQKAAGNASESGFKPTVWSFVVQAVAGATMDSSKDTLQCKTCYHHVSFLFLFLSFLWF